VLPHAEAQGVDSSIESRIAFITLMGVRMQIETANPIHAPSLRLPGAHREGSSPHALTQGNEAGESHIGVRPDASRPVARLLGILGALLDAAGPETRVYQDSKFNMSVIGNDTGAYVLVRPK
jgi:hypothetical protein